MIKSAMLSLGVLFLTVSAQAEKAMPVTSFPVTGKIDWVGYGVGKSHDGDIQVKSGEVKMKGPQIVGGEIVFDMTTLKTDDSPRLQGHLQSPDFFDVKTYPEAKFVIKSAEKLKTAGKDGSTHKIKGDLTIRGKTHPIEIMAKVDGEKGQFKATGNARIEDRTVYDIKYNSKKLFGAEKLLDKAIEDHIDVKIAVQTAAEKK